MFIVYIAVLNYIYRVNHRLIRGHKQASSTASAHMVCIVCIPAIIYYYPACMRRGKVIVVVVDTKIAKSGDVCT